MPVSEILKENRDAFVSFRYPTLSTTGPDWLGLGRAHNVLMEAVDDPAFRQLCPNRHGQDLDCPFGCPYPSHCSSTRPHLQPLPGPILFPSTDAELRCLKCFEDLALGLIDWDLDLRARV